MEKNEVIISKIKKSLKVSIISVSLNNIRGLELTLDSIAQIPIIYRQNFEHIIIDGMSKDATIEYCRNYEKSPYVKTIFIAEQDNGIYNAMNKGLRFTSGEFCVFVNCGDLLEENIDFIMLEHLNYKGRSDFNRNSYFTTNILIEKIQSMISRNFTNDKILYVFDLIKEKCFQNMGGYAAIECCNAIAYSFAESGNIAESLKYFTLIIIHKSDIADSTVGGFYKSAAEYYIDLGYKKEALIMIDMGLEIYPKLAVKKLRNSICS